MMPKISVSPAASRNSSMPSWMPFRHCSIRYSMGPCPAETLQPLGLAPHPPTRSGHDISLKNKTAEAPASAVFRRIGAMSLRHVALADVLVLIVLDDRRDRLQPELVAVLHRVLQVEVLDRHVVRAELE